MRFEWDLEKARRNLAKHGITFELAQRVWDDPLHVIIPDRIADGERRARRRRGQFNRDYSCRAHLSRRRGRRSHQDRWRTQGDIA